MIKKILVAGLIICGLVYLNDKGVISISGIKHLIGNAWTSTVAPTIKQSAPIVKDGVKKAASYIEN